VHTDPLCVHIVPLSVHTDPLCVHIDPPSFG
jgi:hypothetical protein